MNRPAGDSQSIRSSRKGSLSSVAVAPAPQLISARHPSNESLQQPHNWLERPHESHHQRSRGKITHEVKFPHQFNGLYSIRYSPKGEYLITGFGQGAIQCRYNTGEMKRTIRSGGNHSFPVMSIKFHPIYTDIFYAGSSCGNVFKCNTSTGDYARFVEEPHNEVNSLDVTYEGYTLATGGRDAVLRVYDAETGMMKQIFGRGDIELNTERQYRFHKMRVFAVKFNPRTSEVLATGGWDDCIKIWDLRETDGCVRSIRGPHICGEALDLKDKVLITGSWVVHDSLQMWDFGSGKLIDTIVPKNRPTNVNGEFLYACQFHDGDSDEDLVIVGGSGTGFVEVISLKKKMVIGSYKVNKTVQAIDSYRNEIAFGGMETLIRIVDFNK